MKAFTMLLVLLLLAGCSTGWQSTPPAGQRDVLVIESLPPLSAPSAAKGLQLNVLFHVLGDGKVSDVRFLGTASGDAAWDSLARLSMLQWQFARIPGDGPPTDTWVRLPVIVQVQASAPMVMLLGQLWVSHEREADSLYHLLAAGVSFSALTHGVNVAPGDRSGYLGPVDITTFPSKIKSELQDLRDDNKVTKPLHVGDRYVIYRRFTPEEGVAALKQ